MRLLKNKIITELYNSKDLNDLIKKIKPEQLQDDLKQYAFAALCEKSDEFIINLYEKKQLRFFLVRIITNSVFSNRSGFLKLHKNVKELYTNNFPDYQEAEDDYEELITKTNDAVNKLYWYNNELLIQYSRLGTYRAVAEATDIPIKSIHNSVKKSKAIIKRKVWK